MKRFFTILLFISSIQSVLSQSGTITGIVKDSETAQTLPYCNVFVNNTTISTVTDMDGKFTFSGIEPGQIEVSFSFLGYQAETKKVTLNPGGTSTVNLNMKPLDQELDDVEIKASRDKSWEKDLRKFENLFLGNDEVAAKCILENPWVIDFPESTEKGTFIAQALLPIEITNNYLGYKITFDLKEFFDSPTNYRIAGAARFEEMTPASENQKITWEQNRSETYSKSPMNMFRSMISGNQEKEGFYLYGDKPGGSPSMNMRSDIFANELGKSVVPYKPDNLITPASKPGEYLIAMKGRIEIHYQKGYSQLNTYKDAPYPVSWLEVNKNQVHVRENGMILNPQDLVFSGDMDRKRISTILPLDYDADKAIQLKNLEPTAANYQEKVYLHTNKPYYYAGDQLFFKAYFAYGNQFLKDELSKVLHVELINMERDFVIEKKFQIFNGVVVGDFYLPDTLSQEKYFLRAYTNWNRNYGPNHFFVEPISILTPFQRIDQSEAKTLSEPNRIRMQPDKESYGKREKVTLSFLTENQRGGAIQANLSVAVLDQSQVVPIEEVGSIESFLKLEEISPSMGLDRFSYEMEKSLTQKGLVLDEKGKPVQGDVTAYVDDFKGVVERESDRNGEFTLEEMEFFGTMKLAFQATDKKGKPSGKIELVEELKVPFALPTGTYFPKSNQVAEPIWPLETEEESQELEEVLVKEKTVKKPSSIYGSPDYVVEGSKLLSTGNTADLVSSLAGNIPGMRVTIAGASGRQQIRLRGGAASISGSMEPIVMVNGAILVSSGSTTAADNLRTINPEDIERVEIVSKTVSMLGEQGRNGVIAIFLKSGAAGNMDSPNLTKSSMSEFTIEGYQPSSDFYNLDYTQEEIPEGADQRQILYWNPFLVTSEGGKVSVSFYTNDNEVPMTIIIRGLGMDGLPISGTFTINAK